MQNKMMWLEAYPPILWQSISDVVKWGLRSMQYWRRSWFCLTFGAMVEPRSEEDIFHVKRVFLWTHLASSSCVYIINTACVYISCKYNCIYIYVCTCESCRTVHEAMAGVHRWILCCHLPLPSPWSSRNISETCKWCSLIKNMHVNCWYQEN